MQKLKLYIYLNSITNSDLNCIIYWSFIRHDAHHQ